MKLGIAPAAASAPAGIFVPGRIGMLIIRLFPRFARAASWLSLLFVLWLVTIISALSGSTLRIPQIAVAASATSPDPGTDRLVPAGSAVRTPRWGKAESAKMLRSERRRMQWLVPESERAALLHPP
jgi:hypothetical protein